LLQVGYSSSQPTNSIKAVTLNKASNYRATGLSGNGLSD